MQFGNNFRKNLVLFAAVIIVLQMAMAGNIFACDAWWSGAGTDDLWTTVQNWWASGGFPTPDCNIHLDGPLPLVCKINPSTGPVTVFDAYIGDWSQLQRDWANDPNMPTLDVNNQTLNVTRHLLIGVRETIYQPIPVQAIGDVNVINGGTINVGGDLWVGSEGTGILNIGRIGVSGSEVNVTGTLKCPGGPQPPYQAGDGTYPQRYRMGTARINLYKGTLKANDIYSEYNDTAEIDIRAGVLILNGDKTSAISDLIAQGKIYGYTHEGDIQCDYDVRNPGKTTVTSEYTSPWWHNPVSYAINVALNAQLSWSTGRSVTSYDVYFGTSFSNVNDANHSLPPGIFKGNQVATTYDPCDPCSPILNGLVPNRTYFWRIDEIDGVNTYEGYVWRFTTTGYNPYIASYPNPADNTVNIVANQVLSWTKGISANSHAVYLSTSFADVSTSAPSAYKGRVTSATYNPGDLFLGPKTYYWRIDEVNTVQAEPNYWPNTAIWKFSTATYRLIDDFSSYGTGTGTTPPAIGYFWRKSGCTATTTNVAHQFYYVSDRTDSAELFDGNAMMLTYNTTSSPFNSEVNYVPYQGVSLPSAKQDWKLGGVKILGIYVHGEPNNTLEKLYVTVQDFNNNRLKVYYPDSNEMKQQTNEDWIWWVIDLQRFEDAGVYLGKVKNLVIGLGDKVAPGGTGRIYFDNIRLYPRWCPTGYNGSFNQSADADLNNDCAVDISDLTILAEDWLKGSYQVTATSAPSSTGLVVWYMFDDEDGAYEIVDSSGNGYNAALEYPALMVPGHAGNAFAFNGYESFIPVPVAAANDVNLGGHSTVTFWIKDNGQPEAKMLVQIGSLSNRGIVQVWSGWTGYYQYRCGEYPVTYYFDQVDWGRYGYTNPEHILNQWNQYAFTKDHTTGIMRIYHNGCAVAEYRNAFAETMPAFRLSGDELDFFTIGAYQWSGYPDKGGYYKGSMDDFRLYKRALSDEEILYLYLNGAGSITQPVLSRADVVKDNRVNFQDFAVIMNRWLEAPLLWPDN